MQHRHIFKLENMTVCIMKSQERHLLSLSFLWRNSNECALVQVCLLGPKLVLDLQNEDILEMIFFKFFFG